MHSCYLVGVIFALVVLSHDKLFAQNYLFDRSQSGATINGLLGTRNQMLTAGAAAAYSINGTVSMALSGAIVSGKNQPAYKTISPSVSYMFLKQNRIPVSMGVDAEYQYKRFSKIDSLSHHAARFDIGVYHKITFNKNMAIVPGFISGIDLTKVTFDRLSGEQRSHTIRLLSSVQIHNFFIIPSAEYSYKKYFVSISVGVIFRSPDRIDSIY